MNLTDEQLTDLAETLDDTCRSIDYGLEMLDLEPGDYDVIDIEEELSGKGIELCQGCGWWMEVSLLVHEGDDHTGYCEDCI